MVVETRRQVLDRQRVSGGQAIMQALVDNGADIIFGYPGGAIMPTYDALYFEGDRIRHILTRHEQGATHMAEGYARMLRKPGVVLVTSGPGATNTFTGIYDAFMDSTPLVVITGQVGRPLIGTQAFQEAPIVDAARPLTKWAYQVQSAAEIPNVVDRAFAIASSGRPGPVLIDVPKDVQFEQAEYIRFELNGEYKEATLTSEKLIQLQLAADLLNKAQRPFILAGHGVQISKAEKQLLALAEKAGIPVANTLLGLSTFPQDHELFEGMVGMHGRLSANTLTNGTNRIKGADVILAIGMRFDDRVTGRVKDYAKQAKIIHIDIDPTQLNRIIQAEIVINLGAKDALSVLLEKVNPNQHPGWLEQFKKLDAIEQSEVIDKDLSGNSPNLKMAEVVDSLSRKTEGEAVVVADVGQHQMFAARYYQTQRPDSFVTSGGMGTMGFALPAAIGAKIATPGREVIAVVGDGSFQMTPQELGVIMQEQLPVKIIILNNRKLGMVRQWQDSFFEGNQSFVHMDNPDFVRLACAYRIPGERVDQRNELNFALDRMRSARSAYLVEVNVENQENVFPMMPPGAAVNEMVLS